jgi:hypothetical protein
MVLAAPTFFGCVRFLFYLVSESTAKHLVGYGFGDLPATGVDTFDPLLRYEYAPSLTFGRRTLPCTFAGVWTITGRGDMSIELSDPLAFGTAFLRFFWRTFAWIDSAEWARARIALATAASRPGTASNDTRVAHAVRLGSFRFVHGL